MKDIVFTVAQQKRELRWLCACIVAVFVLNAVAIFIYHTEWKELWTQLIWVVCIGIGLYVLSACIRLILSCIIRKKQ